MPIEVSRFTAVLMDQIQLVALGVMVVVYALKIRWILGFPVSRERTPARGSEGAGVRYAMATIALPWALPSTRAHWIRWIEFAVFHLAVAAAIAVTFILPYWPRIVAGAGIVRTLQTIFAAGAVMALSRLIRRVATPELRAITTPDDIFSLVLLALWLAAATLAAPQQSEPWLVALFGMTAFFLVYVPFSKISHYIFWPFIRYYMGKHLGHRGVYPPKTATGHAEGFAR